MLRSDLCDYAYIVVKGRITVNKKLIFKNQKINNTFIDNAEDLDIVMPMQNLLLEYSDNYSMASGGLWNYYRDEINDDANENNADSNKRDNNKTETSKSFEYKTKIIRRAQDNNNTLGTEIVIPLKCFSNFWRFLDLPLINCKIELDLS